MKTLKAALLIGSISLLASCDSCKPASTRLHTVGTYVGGGSVIFGANNCTYSGGAMVFQTSSDSLGDAKTGPRFVFAPGKIVEHCGSSTSEIEAVVPTGVAIVGPKKIKRGGKSEHFAGHFIANDRSLDGQGSIEWQLGKDCEGVATFDTVLGSQDTGGPDRTRTLLPTAPGTCTVILTMTTGSALEESSPEKAFQAEQLVTVE